MACPFFMPLQRWDAGGWLHPSRLPLGAGWMGQCCAGDEPVQPSHDDMREGCNMGYALSCDRLPRQRTADAIRFAVVKDAGTSITLGFVCEANHLPGECGTFDFSTVQQTWTIAPVDTRMRKMAECYLESYLLVRQGRNR